jgi:hypothetical protein
MEGTLMRIVIVLTVLAGAVALLSVAGCGGEEEELSEAGDALYKPPPVEYVVGSVDIDEEAKEPSVTLRIAVAPGTPKKDIKRLFNYFDKHKYPEYDIIWVDVYFDVESAKIGGTENTSLVATLRINRPNFHEERYVDEMLGAVDEDPYRITSDTEETIYLGSRSRMFDSTKQAETLLNLMDERPGHAIYKVTWDGPEHCELTYSLRQKMLVRYYEGRSKETWMDMTVDEIEFATRGGGFGGKRKHGENYTYIRLSPEGEETEEPS